MSKVGEHVAIYALADPHFSFGCAKPMDVFRGWTDYVRRIEENWRKIVRDCDTVILAGDISWAMTLEQAEPDFAFLHALPGTKILLKGNHDYWWSTRKKIEDFWNTHAFNSLKLLYNGAILVEDIAVAGTRGWFFDCEAQEDIKILRREVGRLRTSIQAAKRLSDCVIVFLHYPPITRDRVCEELYQALYQEEISVCYYGHLHGGSCRWAFEGERDGIHFGLISADHLSFCPKLINTDHCALIRRGLRVSVIIPFFNAETTLARAIDSVFAQTVTDWELILVNDGSTDHSLRIAKQFAAQTPQIKMIDQPNRGLSAARNAGIAAASCAYLAFLDADDTLQPPFLEALLSAAESVYADVVHAELTNDVAGAPPQPEPFEANQRVFALTHADIQKKLLHMQQNHFFIYVVRCLYRRDFLREKQICFDEKIRYAEDSLFMMDVFAHAGTALSIERQDYVYWPQPNGMTRSFWTKPDAITLFEAHHAAKLERLERYLPPALFASACGNYASALLETFLPQALQGMYRRDSQVTYRTTAAILNADFVQFALSHSTRAIRPKHNDLNITAAFCAKKRMPWLAYLICKYFWFR
ncbi:MAG: glycosyltransferase [Oscillospiraceae bacterium]|nr:glycosyltransferase [Oscillospiraceae bacterium]